MEIQRREQKVSENDDVAETYMASAMISSDDSEISSSILVQYTFGEHT